MKKATHSEEQSSHSHGQFSSANTKASSKIARVLEHMVFSGPLNRFEAERIGDHCLHSTISSLANNYGLIFKRTPEKVPNHWGAPCDVTRYSLPDSEHHHARYVLELLTQKYTARPLRPELRV